MARGPGHLKGTPKSSVLIIIQLTKSIFKDPDEQYTSELSLPVHHTTHPPTTPIRVAATAPNSIFGEEPWSRAP